MALYHNYGTVSSLLSINVSIDLFSQLGKGISEVAAVADFSLLIQLLPFLEMKSN